MNGATIGRDGLTLVQASAVVTGAFAIGTVAAWGVALDFELPAIAESGWCSLMIAWFPVAVLIGLRRRGVRRATLAAAMLSLIAGFDGVLRLYPGPWGC